MGKVKITLPDGSARDYDNATTPAQIAEGIGKRLAQAALAAKVNGRIVDLDRPIIEDSQVEILTFDSADGKDVYRHSTAHIMADAVVRLYPGTKVTIGPPIDDGFYYDFDRPEAFTPEDLEKIEEGMKEIISADSSFCRKEVSKDEALKFFGEREEKYKVELIEDLKDGEITFYQHGDFVDLCRGPHVPSTGKIKVFKLTGVAGAYWRGDEKREMLQRIYGTSFSDKKELKAHLDRLEEAKKRDHRVLGRELGLFSVNENVGPGLVLWHPNGGRIRTLIEDFWRQEHFRLGYEIVYSPHLGWGKLWETSGHLNFYKENMYSSMDVEEQEYYVKPMNCPFHIQMYKSGLKSYRELPVRLAELGTVYRYERSGVLHGLLRVRGFTQDDAHIFCRPDQVKEEIERCVDFMRFFFRSFGFDKFHVYLSTRDQDGKYAGSLEDWDMATNVLRDVIGDRDLPHDVDEGGAVFYGPKIDVKLLDTLGREWQCTTIQFDFNLPERFDLEFIGEDGKPHRPYMVHRALLGSMERFFGVLIEHYAGAFPIWLAPLQVMVMNIVDRHADYALKVRDELTDQGFRVKADVGDEKIGHKIRDAQLNKIPYMLVIGDREVDQEKVSVRHRHQGDLGAMDLSAFTERATEEIENKV